MDANQRSLQIEAEKTNGDLRNNIVDKGGEHKFI